MLAMDFEPLLRSAIIESLFDAKAHEDFLERMMSHFAARWVGMLCILAMSAKPLDRVAIARALRDVAGLLALAGEEPFRAR